MKAAHARSPHSGRRVMPGACQATTGHVTCVTPERVVQDAGHRSGARCRSSGCGVLTRELFRQQRDDLRKRVATEYADRPVRVAVPPGRPGRY